MRTPKGKKYVSSAAEADQYRKCIKFLPCPVCGRVGALICHGYLRGYAPEGKNRKVIRGYRFFCSNRRKTGKGCGKTHSILLAGYLRGWMIPASTLWAFLKGVASGLSRKAAWERLVPGFSLQAAYRAWKCVEANQSRPRSFLCRMVPPAPSSANEPLLQLIDHLIAAFNSERCPIESFHLHFQRGLLE